MSLSKKLREIWRRFGFYFRREQFDRDLDDEMRFHLAMKARARMESGAQSREAEFEARRLFGNQTLLKERSREMWAIRWIEAIGKDLQFTFRMIRKSPVFAAVVILSLALAIGANTAIFSYVDAVLLKSMPVKNPEELVLFGASGGPKTYVVSHSGSGSRDKTTGIRLYSSLSSEIFERMQQQNQTLTDLFAFTPISNHLNVSLDNRADIATGQYVSGGYYKGLGVRMIIGRPIVQDDDKIGAPPVAVITEHFWRERFSADPAISGKPAYINGQPFTIIGVSQPGFEGALGLNRTADVSLPLSATAVLSRKASDLRDKWDWWLRIMGRLKPGVSIAQAQASFQPIVQQTAMEELAGYLDKYPEPRFADAVPPNLTAIPGGQGEMFARRESAMQLYILLIIVGLVLFIACVNVANLLLARSSARQKEIAVRIALGAGKMRLIRQLLTESVTLSVAGGLAGFVLAWWGKNLLGLTSPWDGQPLKVDTSLDAKVLAFTAAASVGTGILFGIAPALKAIRIDPGPALKETASSQSTRRSWFSLGRGLVVIQVALSIVLLVGAGLFLRTLRNLQRVDYGFDAQNMLLFDVNPSLNGYTGERLSNIYQQIAERTDAIPGVKSTTISLYPMMKGWGWSMGTPTVPGSKKVVEDGNIYMFPVRNNFLDTMRIPLIAGRVFDDRDNADSAKVAIANQAFVKMVFEEDRPIGQHFQFELNNGTRVFELVGIAKDTIYADLRSAPEPIVYLPYLQQMHEIDRFGEGMTYEVKTYGDPNSLVPAVREVIRSIDDKIPIQNVKTQSNQIDEMMSRERVFARLTSGLGLLVLILAGLGLYGVMSYNVTRRTREIGIRMALGAGTRRVLGQVMRETIVMVVIGIVFGVMVSYAATRFISTRLIGWTDDQSMLFGVSPHDPASIALAAVFLLGIAVFAGYLPARRAARVDPLVALRYD